MKRFTRQRAALLLLVIALTASFSLPVFAADDKKSTSKETASSKPAESDASVTQTYNAGQNIRTGMLVQLDAKDPNTVLPVTESTASNLLGVIIPKDDSPIVLTREIVKGQQVLVSTSGNYSVLVSNQNGPIKVGDYIVISALSGIGMRAGQDQKQVVGKATSNFTGSANVISSTKLKDSSGKDNNVAIGRVDVDVRVGHNPLNQQTVDAIPGFLLDLAVSVAGKPVSVARIYLSTAILIIAGFVTANLVYSGIRGGMIAVGRNPLSKKSIRSSLVQTVIAGLFVFASGVFAVYLLLKL